MRGPSAPTRPARSAPARTAPAWRSLRPVRSRPVDDDGDTVADDPRIDQHHRLLVARVAEETLSLAQDDREHHQPELVDEVVLDERTHQGGAAVDDDVDVDLVLQPRDLYRHMAIDDG